MSSTIECNDDEALRENFADLSQIISSSRDDEREPNPYLDAFFAELDAIRVDDTDPEPVAEAADEIDANVSDETPVAEPLDDASAEMLDEIEKAIAEAETVAAPTAEISTDLAPGCFGSALTYRADATECLQCMFASRCQPIHVDSVALLTAALATHPDTLRRRALHEKKKVADKERIARARAEAKATTSTSTSTSTSTAASPTGSLDDLKDGYQARLDALRTATAGPSLSHSLRKLKGREADLASWWVARQMARAKHGPKASASRVAEYRTRISRGAEAFSKKQAENALARIAALEAPGSVWCGLA